MTNDTYDYSLHYQAFHPDTKEHAQDMARWHAAQLKEHLSSVAIESCFLDVGCGMGYAMEGLALLGFKNVEGIDCDRNQAESCLRRQLCVTWTKDSLGYLNTKKESYDVVLMLDVLEHIRVEEQITVMRAVYGSLRPGGRVILTVPNANAMFACRWRYIDYTHHASFTHYSLEFVLKNAGFLKIQIDEDQILKTKPSLRLWRKGVYSQWVRWFVRRLWKKMFQIEISWENANHMSFDLHLMAVAFKNGQE